ncbi:hypothetical protein F8M41_009626 [Gigaspora margarita]|uniref:Uncharacterized protein n=1 Tax=Gigaspora margarita TaxID=4874 RepID=A0A8H3X2R3_GIGMA|nr:hypothetical protein F8M41_009626 [Gigaspora margarita]
MIDNNKDTANRSEDLPIVIESEKPKDDEFKSNLDNGMYKHNISYRDKSNNVIIENINGMSSRDCHNQDRVEIEMSEQKMSSHHQNGIGFSKNDHKASDFCQKSAGNENSKGQLNNIII